jgi:2,5-diamino-6-(ribosylamino)-4(3H)-pyrimidinone 5'-phosphate reductase
MDRPRVVILNSASVDGRLAVSPEVLLLHGDERWQAMESWSPVAPKESVFARLKALHAPQATLEGSGSFVLKSHSPEPLPPHRADSASLYADYLPEGKVKRPDHRGWFVVVDGRGRGRDWIVDGTVFGPEWTGWHLLLLVGQHTPCDYLAYLREAQIPYLVAGDGHVDLGQALAKLHAQLGVNCVLSTAGGKLNGALLRAGLVDEVNVEFLPAIVGGTETPSLYDAPSLAADEWPVRLELVSCQVQGSRVWLRYQVVGQEEDSLSRTAQR